MNNFLTLTMLKRYVLAMGCLAVIGLLVFAVGKLSDLFTAPQEPEQVYQVPEPPPEPPAIPPEVLAAHQKKVERLQAVEAQLMTAASTSNPEDMLAQLELEQEMLTLHQEFGTLEVEQGDPFLSIKIGKLMLTNMTDDNQLPVSVGLKLVDLLIESGDIEGAATVYMATQYATERGDKFFKPSHWGDRRTASQPSVERPVHTPDPCCPDDPMVEVSNRESTPVSKTPKLFTTDSVVEVQPQKPLSVDRFNQARALIDEYGTEEGLQRLKAVDPEVVDRLGFVPRLDSVPAVDDP